MSIDQVTDSHEAAEQTESGVRKSPRDASIEQLAWSKRLDKPEWITGKSLQRSLEASLRGYSPEGKYTLEDTLDRGVLLTHPDNVGGASILRLNSIDESFEHYALTTHPEIGTSVVTRETVDSKSKQYIALESRTDMTFFADFTMDEEDPLATDEASFEYLEECRKAVDQYRDKHHKKVVRAGAGKAIRSFFTRS